MRYMSTDRETPPALEPDDRERALMEYVAGPLPPLLGLRDWAVDVRKGEPGEDIIATAEVAYGRKVVTVTLGPKFFALGPEEQRSTAAHELLHAHLDAPHAVLRDIETQLGTLQFDLINETYRRRNEETTDALAEVVAKWLPLPPGAG